MHLQKLQKSGNIIPMYGYEVSHHHIYKNWCSTRNTGLHPMRVINIANQGTPLPFMTSFPSHLTLQLSL
jgi:hypothetical protein